MERRYCDCCGTECPGGDPIKTMATRQALDLKEKNGWRSPYARLTARVEGVLTQSGHDDEIRPGTDVCHACAANLLEKLRVAVLEAGARWKESRRDHGRGDRAATTGADQAAEGGA